MSHEPTPLGPVVLVFTDGREWIATPEATSNGPFWTITDDAGTFRDCGHDRVVDSPRTWSSIATDGEPDVAEAWCALHFATRQGIPDRRAMRAAG